MARLGVRLAIAAAQWLHHYELQPPEAAIPPEEDAVSIEAAIALRESFAKESPAVRALFDALTELLTGGGQKH